MEPDGCITANLKIMALVPDPVWVAIRTEMPVEVETDQSNVGYRSVTSW